MRLEKICIGDCSTCELLRAGEVDMIPCILDQSFQRIRKLEKTIEDIRGSICRLEENKTKPVSLAGCSISEPKAE